MTVEKLDKITNTVTEIPLRDYIKDLPYGTQGKLNVLLSLCDGDVLQNTQWAERLKGIPHTWDW